MAIVYGTGIPATAEHVKVSTRFTLTIGLTGLAFFGALGAYQLRVERRDLFRAVERETRLLGRTLRVAAENAQRDSQSQDIFETLQAVHESDPPIDMVVFDALGSVIARSGGAREVDPSVADCGATAVAARASVLRRDPQGEPVRILLALPLLDDAGSHVGGIVMVRPLDDLREDLARTRRAIVVTVALFAALTAALGRLLGAAYIARPLARLTARMRQVRAGEFPSKLPEGRPDEIGLLAQEFHAMLDDLREARSRLVQETESRARLERGLERVDKLATIGQLSAGLAHEIGSPLQVLHGRARALLARPADQEDVRRNAQILVEHSERIARIVERLLSFARRRPPSFALVRLEPTVRRVLDLLEVEARRRQVRVRMRAGDEPLGLLADADQLQQVVLNLVKNALEATPPGGEIEVELEKGALAGADGALPSVRIVVTDTGRGMSEDVCRRIFEPFFTTRPQEGGTGLGLVVARAIARDHGGELTAASNPGLGTRMTVELPIGAPVAREAGVT